jgi:hypothetical protein
VATFSRGQTVETSDPQIEVETRPLRDPTGAVTLGPGRHVFQLIVEDHLGRRSLAATAEVEVFETVIKQPNLLTKVVQLIRWLWGKIFGP